MNGSYKTLSQASESPLAKAGLRKTSDGLRSRGRGMVGPRKQHRSIPTDCPPGFQSRTMFAGFLEQQQSAMLARTSRRSSRWARRPILEPPPPSNKQTTKNKTNWVARNTIFRNSVRGWMRYWFFVYSQYLYGLPRSHCRQDASHNVYAA